MNDLVDLVKNVGVPAGIAFYVLYKVNRTMEQLVREIKGLSAFMGINMADLERRVGRLEDHEASLK